MLTVQQQRSKTLRYLTKLRLRAPVPQTVVYHIRIKKMQLLKFSYLRGLRMVSEYAANFLSFESKTYCLIASTVCLDLYTEIASFADSGFFRQANTMIK